MLYMLSYYETPADLAARDGAGSAAAEYWPAWNAYFAGLRESGALAGGAPLQRAERAATVRGDGDGRAVHDGPYADSKEQLAGFAIVDVPALDDALGWARRAPAARTGAVEVRPLWPTGSSEVDGMARVDGSSASHVLAIYESPEDFAAREGPAAGAYWGAWSAFSTAMGDAGIERGGAALRAPESATVVRSGTTGTDVHDGPYADTREQLGGVIYLTVASQDDALAWAARCPAVRNGAVEVRPVYRH